MPDLQSVLLGLGALVLVGLAGTLCFVLLLCCLGLALAPWRLLLAQWRDKS